MSEETPQTIKVLARSDPNESRSDRTTLVTSLLDVGVLRDQFKGFLRGLQSMIDVGDESVQGFHLAEIQFSAELTGTGEFRLLGTGVGLQASSAITFVLQRRAASQQLEA
jgi:hypothetical protein